MFAKLTTKIFGTEFDLTFHGYDEEGYFNAESVEYIKNNLSEKQIELVEEWIWNNIEFLEDQINSKKFEY